MGSGMGVTGKGAVCAALILCLTGCEQPVPPVSPPPASPAPVSDPCGAARLQGLVGQSRAAVERLSLPKGTRIIGYKSPVTLDYRPDRLNIELDEKDRVAKLSCF